MTSGDFRCGSQGHARLLDFVWNRLWDVLSRSVMSDSLWPQAPPGFYVHGIFQARILEWGAISFSRGSSWPRDQTCISCIAGGFFTTEPTRKPYKGVNMRENWVRVYRNSALFLQLFHKLKIVYLKICPHNHVGLSLWLSSKQSTCNAETWVWSLCREDPLEQGMATHSGILSWRIPWTEEPGGQQSIELQRVGHAWSDLACMHTYICITTHI